MMDLLTPTRQINIALPEPEEMPQRNALTSGDYAGTSSASFQSGTRSDLGTRDGIPNQPILQKYPLDEKKRHFRSIWFNDFSWLEYSIMNDTAHCYACRNFSTGLASKSEDSFRDGGFKGWVKAIERFKIHANTSDHKFSMTAWGKIQTNQRTQ